MSSTPRSRDLNYPQLLQASENASREAQRRFYASKAIELCALTLGAGFGLIDSSELHGAGPVLAVLMFVVAIGLEISHFGQTAERRWYDARAAAESVKSASWQYAVAGEAFRLGQANAESDLVSRLQEIMNGLTHLDVGARLMSSSGVTADMMQLRASSQLDRYARYAEARLQDQVNWYTQKAAWNKARAWYWRWALVLCEGTALVLGLLRIKGDVGPDLLGLFATGGAGLIAWIQAKNFTYLAESYAVTSHEIGLVSQSVRAGVDEDKWAQSIHDAEAAFSREHTMWVARRQGAIKGQ